MCEQNRYQLRHAAGRYWLLDMEQEGLDYHKPVELNECAALIWKLSRQGLDSGAIATRLQEIYGISSAQANEDTEQFIKCLKEQGFV